MDKIVLLSGGGHCKSIIDSIIGSNDFEIVGITDSLAKGSVFNIDILGNDEVLAELHENGVEYAFISLGSVGDTHIRIKLYEEIKDIGFKVPIIIDKTAIVSEKSKIGEGSFIGKGAIVNSGTVIGKNCIINSGAIVEHDCLIGDFVHVSPGATICGGVKIGNNSHVGSNSTIIECLRVGENVIIGAGSVIVKSVQSNVKVYGNPGRIR